MRCAGPRIPGIRRLLVVRTDRLGDFVLTLPAIRVLRRAYPDVWLGAMVSPGIAPLARTAEDVDEVLVAPPSIAGLSAVMVAFRPDVALFVSRSPREPMAAWRAGLPNRVGSGYRWYSPWLHRRVDERRRAGRRHEAEFALSFAHRVGGQSAEAEFPIALPKAVREAADAWIAMQRVGRRFVIVHPGSGGSCPNWPVSHWVELTALLEGQGIRVAFSIGPGDREVERALDREHMRIRRLPRFRGSVVPLAGLLARAAVVVGASTGPLHLAAALGTPTLMLQVPWPTCGPSRWGPYSERGWSLVADLPEARGWTRAARALHGERLLAGIPTVEAARCVEAMVEGRSPLRDPLSRSTV